MKTIRTRPVRIGERFIGLAIESVESNRHRSHEACGFSALVEPVALVVCGSEPARALDMQGNPVDMDALRRDVPALDSALVASDPSFD